MAGANEETEEGRILMEIRTLLVEWGKPLPEATTGLQRAIRTSRATFDRAAIALTVAVLGMATVSFLFMQTGAFFLFLFVPLGYWLQRDATGGVDAPGEPDPQRAARLVQLMHRLLDRSFVTVIDGAVVEHIPHCALLRTRLLEIDRAEANLKSRSSEIEATRRDIARLNEKMGRPVEDVETERLTELLTAERQQLVDLGSMREELTATLGRTEELLGELRMTAVRRALSERASKLTAGSATAGEALAAAETELSGYSARLGELARETAAADMRLGSLLELQR